MPSTGRVETIEHHANGAGLDESEGPYRYFPLQPDSMQIRVLSVLPRGSQLDGFLRCTLRTVDLNDWTIPYREVLAKYRKLPKSPRLRLGLWYQQSSRRYSRADCFTEEEIANLSRTLVMDGELSVKGDQEIHSRFDWGDYIALSYVWGDVTDKISILLDGHRFPVTKGLHEALSHLRDAFEMQERELHVWADAVCIKSGGSRGEGERG